MTTTRTFIAVEVNRQVRTRATDLIRQLEPCDVKVKWVEPENMHLTIKFLGDQTDKQLAEISQAVLDAAAEVPAFEFRCRGAGAFPTVERPRTVWIGVDEGLEPFGRLHAAVDRRLATAGFPKDRRAFRPHLTIGRVRSGGPGQRELGRLIEQHADFAVGTVDVHQVLVMSSFLDRSGPTYQVIARAPLGSAAP